jgi:uncharacterized protein YraI
MKRLLSIVVLLFTFALNTPVLAQGECIIEDEQLFQILLGIVEAQQALINDDAAAASSSLAIVQGLLSSIDCGATATGVIAIAPSGININVRTIPNENSGTVLGTISSDNSPSVTGQAECPDGNWLQIEFEGRNAWISASFVEVEGNMDTVPTLDDACSASASTSSDNEVTLTFRTNPLACSVTSVRNCGQITGISVNGNNLTPGTSVTLDLNAAVNIDSISFSISQENLNIVNEKHEGAGYTYGYAFPQDIEALNQASLGNEGINPLLAGSFTIGTSGGVGPFENAKQYTHITVLIMHENKVVGPNEFSVEEAIAAAVLEID